MLSSSRYKKQTLGESDIGAFFTRFHVADHHHACRYARVDRRPLDPPPVVQLKLYHIHNEGTEHESEQEVQDYE